MTGPEFLRASLSLPFQWGVRDCALWSADFVLSQTGIDPAAAFRGTYDSKFACLQVLKRHGGLLATVRPGMAPFAPLNGDGVAVARVDGRQMCGVVLGDVLHVLTERNALRLVRGFDLVEGWSWSRR